MKNNDQYSEEIKTFLQGLSEIESLKESLLSLRIDSYCTDIMIGLISSYENITDLKIIDSIYLEGEYLPILKTRKLTRLNLSGNYQIQAGVILSLVEQNKETLRSLKLDGESMEGGELTEAVGYLEVLEELCVYYGNSASSDLLKVVGRHCGTLERLVIRKNENFLEKDLEFFFDNKFPKLRMLVLDECTHLDTECVKKIATNCLVLETYSSEWCLKIDSEAVENLILNCENLKTISLSGIKTIDDSVFSKIFEINQKNQKEGLPIIPLKLTKINFKMCNYLSKPVLEQMNKYYPNLTIVDYYGEEITHNGTEFTNYSSDI